MLLTELLSPDRVVVPLPAGDRHSAIAALTRRLADRAGALEVPDVAAERWNAYLALHGIPAQREVPA